MTLYLSSYVITSFAYILGTKFPIKRPFIKV